MVYIIKINVDGGCRANSQPGLITSAAAAFKDENGKYHGKKAIALPSFPRLTN
ncbi:hypothetical protein BDV19DRAFT_356780 [Aspergillus venezuelensis]